METSWLYGALSAAWCLVWLFWLLNSLALLGDCDLLPFYQLLQFPHLCLLGLQASLQPLDLSVCVDALRLGHWRLRAGYERAQLLVGLGKPPLRLLEPKLSLLQGRRCDRGPEGHVHAAIKRHVCL